MYVSGEETEEVVGKKHTIKDRRKAVGTALLQVADVTLAAGVVLALQKFSGYFSFSTSGAIAVGLIAFAAKKGINKAWRFGKKHHIQAREKGDKKSARIVN